MKLKTWLTIGLLLAGTAPAFAGAKLQISEKASIDLGFRLQVLGIFTDADIDGDGQFESSDDFKIRRARFRLTGTVNEHFSMFFQTDVSGNDIVMIDAYVHLKKDAGLQVFLGQHLVPTSREAITSSGTLLTMDRPALVYKALTWGGRALSTFDNTTYGDANAGFSGNAQVRDTGATLFGFHDMSEKAHLKYFVGMYDGISAPGTDSERYAARFQLNFGDSEASFYSTANYLGKKDTVGIGISYDTQSDVAGSRTPQTDYTSLAADVFVSKGPLTLEAAYQQLDLDDANLQAEGDGFYVQGGYLMSNNKWQPWIHYETWSADAASGKGSYDMIRVGLSYFMAGHNANFKIGYESFMADALIGSTNEDTINSIVIGFYTTY